jgi:ankyrin repeat protein
LQIAATNPEMLKQLTTGGADVRKANGVIEKAVFRNSVESIPILVAAGAPVDGHPEDYYRPLYTAVRDNLPECMSKLLSLGADPNIIAGEGSPFLLAASHGDPTKLKILLDAGADVNLAQDGVTALMRACEHNLVGNVELLLEKGANAHIVDSRGRTAMEIASEKGHDDLVMLLLEAMS